MMFQECGELKTLDLSNFDTKNVTDMGFMFNKCKNLKEIKGINKFVTKEVKNMERMFSECSELETLDLSSFTTYNTTKISYMFDNCKKLKEFKGNSDLVEKYNSSKYLSYFNNLESNKFNYLEELYFSTKLSFPLNSFNFLHLSNIYEILVVL